MKPSYTGPHLEPYIRAAESFAKKHKEDRYIQWSLDHITAALANAGPVQRVNDLPWMEASAKAKASLAMLREKGVPALRILAVTLGVRAAIAEDTYGPGSDIVIFRRVQIAKALRRRASRTHVVSESGWRLSRYPRSSGKVLEVLGTMMEKACDFALHEHLQAILELKQHRYGVLPIPPRGTFAKSRHGNTKVDPPSPAVSLKAGSKTAIREAEAREAERIAKELHEAFAKDGYAAFGPRRS
jgi:hypothetical protein